MPTYRYLALDLEGRRRRDVIQAENERHARELLSDRGLFARRLEEIRGARQRRRGQRLDAERLTLLTRQLATLIDAGIPIGQALEALASQADREAARALLLSLVNRVREGYSLADSLKAHPASFDRLYVALVAAGERAGQLPQVLERLADHLERSQRQRQKAKGALVYPLVLVLVSVGVVSGLMTYVVPRLAAQFERSDMTLPWLTRGLIALADAMQSLGPWLLATLLLLGLAAARSLRRPAIRLKVDRRLLTLPRLGELLLLLDSARLTRTLAILTLSGIPLVDALRVSRDTLANACLRHHLGEVEEAVTSGVSLHRALADTGRFSPTLLHMVASGESSGRLGEMLERVAATQESAFSRRVDMALALFEPLIILAMGGVVLTIVLAILLPIMSLNSAMAL
ncbi:type II secretion system inner membrane protein GspF [Halomonas elongata]|uniref:General secretion pathway protein F n=4 Tax=Halomonas elongata TaxID=2746 RepID=E1V5F0_HALED|nr:type II secretion system inner membrane protein GspF [Halomonas elongata]WBF16845.1 type II secretion system inner membrane protein GspF [Halomonas elongata]WPU45676.1 type II secretion system inner membrane protein GspF [Halomonas elongata DSM 2581]WVI70520.1 type II secretion system inner membrane protein GspF [Halomonas elongata]CBV43105.1 general secretion pathway protein GspF [Halomonas elongata DSM 2581]